MNMLSLSANLSFDTNDFENALEIFTQLEKPFFHQENTPIVYHYTSTDGLLGILQEDAIHLRFTKYDCLNDKSERYNIMELLNSVITELIEMETYPQDFLKEISHIKLSNKEYLETLDKNNQKIVKELNVERFLCCFSKNPDSLGMWRYYVKNNTCEGYCIGLSTSVNLKEKDKKTHLPCKDVIYNDKEKRDFLLSKIAFIYKLKKYSSSSKNNFMNVLNEESLYFKNSCFADEEEIRSELLVTKENSSSKSKNKIEFRNNNGHISPYIELKFSKSLLKSVNLSPLMTNDDIKNLKYLLKIRGYKNYFINKSSLPIRF